MIGGTGGDISAVDDVWQVREDELIPVDGTEFAEPPLLDIGIAVVRDPEDRTEAHIAVYGPGMNSSTPRWPLVDEIAPRNIPQVQTVLEDLQSYTEPTDMLLQGADPPAALQPRRNGRPSTSSER
jgi:hypothetical protein